MKKTLLILLSLFVFVSLGAAQPTQVVPTEYYGSIDYENGEVVDSGTVKAVVDNQIKASTSFTDGSYELVVQRNQSSEDFSEVSFVVDDYDTGRSASFEAFGSQQVNLTVPAPEEETSEEDDGGSGSSGGGGGGGFAGANFGEEEDNEIPVAGFTWDTPVRPGEQVVLDASGSFDPDGNISSYEWSIGATGETAETVFDSTGRHSVTLTVEDDEGSSQNVTNDVVVTKNKVPVPSFKIVYTGSSVLEDVRFNASDSYDPDGSITNYDWSFGDSGVSTSQSFQEAGNVTLTVVDNEGETASVTKQLNERVDSESSEGSPDENLTGSFTESETAVVGIVSVLLLIAGIYIIRKKDLSIAVQRNNEN